MCRPLSPVVRSLRPEASHGAKHYVEGGEYWVCRPLSPLCVCVVCVLRGVSWVSDCDKAPRVC